FFLEQDDLVGRRVVEGGNEQAGLWDLDSARGETRADLGIVQERSRGAGVHVARLATARATVDSRGVGVVLRLAPVSHEQHEAREALRETDRLEQAFGDLASLFGGERCSIHATRDSRQAHLVFAGQEPGVLLAIPSAFATGKGVTEHIAREEE